MQTPFTSNVLTKVEAAPWPYFPVDLLPIFIALGVCAEGNAMFWNKVYDGALGWTGELSKFGAHVFSSDPHRVVTFGGNALTPAVVESPYIIRVAIALFMVASSIKGRPRSATPRRSAAPIRASSRTCAAWACRWSGPTRNEDRRGPGAYFASAPQALRVSMPRNCLSRSWTRSPIC